MVRRRIHLLAITVAYLMMLGHSLFPHHHHSIAFDLNAELGDAHHAEADAHDLHHTSWGSPHYAGEMDHSHDGTGQTHNHTIEGHSPTYINPKDFDAQVSSVTIAPMPALVLAALLLPAPISEPTPIPVWESPPILSKAETCACGLRAPPAHLA